MVLAILFGNTILFLYLCGQIRLVMYEYEYWLAFYGIVILTILIVNGLPKDVKEKAKNVLYGGIVTYLSILSVLQALLFIAIAGCLWYGAYWLIVNGHPIIGLIAFVLILKVTIKLIIGLVKHIKDKLGKNNHE